MHMRITDLFTAFTRSLFDRGISKPDTYDEDTVDNILEDMKKQKTNEVEEKPNIIFIQLESFMDLNACRE